VKLGYVYGDIQQNKIYEAGDAFRIGDFVYSSSYEVFPRLYPKEKYAVLNPLNINLDICKQLDAVIYLVGPPKDNVFVDIVKSIPCLFLSYLALGYTTLTTKAMKGMIIRKQILDSSDVVLVPTKYGIELVQMWTNTKVEYFPLPVPVNYAQKILKVDIPVDVPQYDIVVAYGPNQSQVYPRNGYTNVLLAEKMVRELQEFNSIGVFACTGNNEVIKEMQNLLDVMGCNHCRIIPRVSYKDFLQILSKTKVCIDLDMGQSAGKFLVDCAIVQKPVIAADTIPTAEMIYHDIKLHSPWDIASMMKTALLIANGGWKEGWLRKAYIRGIQHSIWRTVQILDGIIRRNCEV
jgi:hypothetical protein